MLKRNNVKPAPVLIVFVSLLAWSCAPAVSPAQKEAAEKKFAEYQLAKAVVARSQTCLETLLPELRATVEGNEDGKSEREFAAKWGLKTYDPNTGFDDAWAACVGRPTLKELGIGDDETALNFLERKRREWEQADPAEAADRSISK